MAEKAEVKNEVSVEEYEQVKAELEQVKNELEQYKAAYKEQMEKYNSLFSLFANNINYVVDSTIKKEGK